MILREGVRLVAIGVASGGAVSLAAAGSVGSMLFIKNPRDVLTFTLVPAALVRGGCARLLDPGDSRSPHRPLGCAARRVSGFTRRTSLIPRALWRKVGDRAEAPLWLFALLAAPRFKALFVSNAARR